MPSDLALFDAPTAEAWANASGHTGCPQIRQVLELLADEHVDISLLPPLNHFALACAINLIISVSDSDLSSAVILIVSHSGSTL